ncbi:MAG: penicillin-binding transpeptidase domain-containing protein, partial [Anaerovoracaceae bacterium]
NGLSGLEQYYNKYLRGVSGRWIQSKDANGRSLSYGDEEYYAAEDGSNIVLTIDSVIQNYAEKAIASDKSQYKADRVSCIAMDPKTGEVLAMASNPGFNPNTSRVPTDPAEAEALAALPEEEQLDYLNKMWRNPLVSDTYVPGSTMKLITTAMALEEDVTNLNEGFYDTGSINVSGVQLKCWSYAQPHGSETLKEAVGNSCNPVFVQLAQRLGIEKFYDYLGLFGITEKTGIDYPGEGVSQLQNVDTAGPVGLATMGYGQGIAVTPIELITAISAFGNEGMLMQPHLVKEIQNSKGETVKKIQPTKVKQAVSQATAAQICDTMEFVVTNGGSGNAKIDGYRVGGKTGTANTEADNNKITASFVGMAPMEDPQIVVLFIVVNPEGAIYGSTVAAPGGKEVIENSLRRLKIKPSSEVTQSGKNKTVTVPAVAGKSLGEAKAILEGSGLTYKVSPAQEEEVEFTVVDQYPKSGEGIEAGGTVYLYRE